ncbi:glycosyltransferase family 2 protein [Rhodopila sp.]|uniref:glycosyltransferase family 2 protein n=1 Tax=Rhodopila sp. TaxID=2480087 RepID=UPI003D150741
MSSFDSLAETRKLGAPVVRLFRVALGRDPDPTALQDFASRLRQGASLPELARDIIHSAAFRRLHGCDVASDAAFIARIAANALPKGAAREAARIALLAAADLGMDRADLLAALADSPLGRDHIPLLPGLAPGVPPDDAAAYRLWVAEYDNPGEAELARIPPLRDGPLVSIVMTAGDSTVEGALRSVDSLRRQTYGNWELLLTTRLLSAWPAEALTAAAGAEPRLRLLDAPYGTTNRADWQQAGLAQSSGKLVCFLHAGDTLPPTALHEVAAAIAAHPQTQLLYTDEDVADAGGRRNPRFKPDFSPDLLLAGNSIGQLAVYRMELLDRLGGLQPAASPYTDYDLVLRAVALAEPGVVFHLPAVLCHRAEPAADWPARPDNPPRAAPALLAVETAPWPRLRFRLPVPPPLVSVIVPTRDRPDLLSACLAGVLERTDYPAIELLVVDNGSHDPEALALLSRLEVTPRVRVLRHPEPFNFAALNNAAAAEAAGEVLLLLNNDTEVLHPDWLGELVSHVARHDVGAVGARLLYPDGTVQHAGMLLGPAGAAVHVGRFASPDAPGYDGQLVCTRDLSAVTGACLALRRETFRAVGGMDERLAVAWNDVDLCLRVRATGLRVIWTPHAVLLHREAVTRGLEAEDPAKLARFHREQALMQAHWTDAMEADPFLNPNLLASETGPLVLTRPRVRRPWQA